MPQEAPLKWTVKATLASWSAEQVEQVARELGRQPSCDELAARFAPRIETADGNMLVTTGLTRFMNLLIGSGAQALDATHTRIGIGDSQTAEAAGDTDLKATTNKLFQVMDAGYPQVNAGVYTARATYQGNDANWQWNEWGIDVTSGAAAMNAVVGTLINRKVQQFSTKATGEVRQFTVTLTLS